MKKPRIKLSHITSSLLIAVMAATAQVTSAQQNDPLQWDVKIGPRLESYSTPWVGGDHQNEWFPYMSASYGNWKIGGNSQSLLSYQAIKNQTWGLSMGLGYRDDGYDSGFSDDPVFSGYDAPDADITAFVGLSYDSLFIQASQDVSSNSESSALSITLKHPLYRSQAGFMLNVSAAAHWYDKDYVNYNYGVNEDQVNAAVGRTVYQGDAALNLDLGLSAIYRINKQWMLIGSVNLIELDDEITDSPLIDDDHADITRVILGYRF